MEALRWTTFDKTYANNGKKTAHTHTASGSTALSSVRFALRSVAVESAIRRLCGDVERLRQRARAAAG